VIIEIDTSPKQKFISKDGSYSFNVPVGRYTINAGLYLDNLLDAFATENISIITEGEYHLDLIIFPYIGADEELISGIDIYIPEKLFEDKDVYAPDKEKTGLWLIISIIIIILAASIIFIAAFFVIRKMIAKPIMRSEIPAGEAPVKEKINGTLISVTKDLQDLIEIIKREGGRTTQKEIRKHIPLSEAKISLMIAELEDKGIIKKIKKGRGNIIILRI